ncbi:MAG: 30S ribosomal protein S16 [Geodermatophilaceae bacterium]|nr:30S ribosomal protein S16 [Geodermatophilaceae bacterium]
MSTKIKLMRRGKTRQPYYRIVVADSRTKRDGRSIEEIGKYHPKEDPSYMEVDSDRVAYWLGVGAQPTDAVRAILRVTGDWQKFYGEPAPAPMLVKAPKPDRRAAFETATQLGGAEPDAAATTPKKKTGKNAEAPADIPVDRADKTDVEVDVEAQSPRAGVRQSGAKAPDSKAAATVDSTSDTKADAATADTADQDDDASGGGLLQSVVNVVENTVERAAEVVEKAVGKTDKADPSTAKGTEA